MRKYIFLPVLLFVLSISGIAFIYGEISEDREVNITANALAGDVNKVHELEIKNQVEYNYDHTYDWINWETTFTPEKPGKIKAAISYVIQEGASHDSDSLNLEDMSDAICLFQQYEDITEIASDTLNIKDFVSESLPEEALTDALTATPAGTTKIHTIHLKDYLSYCPASSDFSVDGWNIKGDGTDYLKIPVTDDMECVIKIGKDEKGNLSSFHNIVSYESNRLEESGPPVNLHQRAIANDDYFYVAMDHYTCKDKRYILGEKQRGIHVIPHTRKGVTNYLDFENAYLAYPLNEEEQLLSLNYSEDKEDLILITRNEKRTYVTVIEESSMKEKQKISAKISMTDEEDSKILQEGDNILFLSKGNYALITEKGDHYVTALTGSLYDSGLNPYDASYVNFAYDGTQLAIIFNAFDEAPMDLYKGFEFIDIAELQVFDQTGLLYAGHYDSGLPKEYFFPSEYGRYLSVACNSLSFQNTK